MGGSVERSPKKKHGDSPEERFVANVAYAFLALVATIAVVFNTMSAYGFETVRPLTNIKCGMAAGIAIPSLLYLRFFGLTLYFRVSVSVATFCMCIFTSVTSHPMDTWHLLMVLILDFVSILKSDDDALIMSMLSRGFLFGFVVYAVLHNLSASGLGPDIHFYYGDRCDFHMPSNLGVNVSVVLLNFKLVTSYGRDLRSEAKSIRVSVQAAIDVSRALVDFDLDGAHGLMACMEEDSPIFEPLMQLIHNLQAYRPFLPAYLFPQTSWGAGPAYEGDSPNEVIVEAISGKSTSWSHAKTAVERLRDPEYSLNDFHADVEAAFPELTLYNVESDGSRYSSGRTGLEEYQRTLGALYSVYCIARLDIDGREVFSFGVDAKGKPAAATSGDYAAEKEAFYRSMDWKRMLELFARAGLLKVAASPQRLRRSLGRSWSANGNSVSAPGSANTKRSKSGGIRTPDDALPLTPGSANTKRSKSGGIRTPDDALPLTPGRANTKRSKSGGIRTPDDALPLTQDWDPEDWDLQIKVDAERMTAFLVLTAIHDIMKNPSLLMTVQKKHAPYQGVAEGDHIYDHDLALMYTMEHYPGLLPSFNGLGPGQRAAVFFSQGKMGFNNGWLVQGEAPPGALFSKFKEVITLGGASASDVSFYFAHWLTDLAGAEPFGARPWPGSEKFALKFPHKVLRAFLDSFNYVGRLNGASEVEVMEEYLRGRWSALDPPEGAFSEDCAVASMRLALMAQGFELAAVAALKALPPPDRDLLAAELARTGLREQFAGGPAGVCSRPTGPALLVYYAPALIQKAGADQAGDALLVLAAVCRAARELFPLEAGPQAVESTVVIRIDALKVLTPPEIGAAGPWLLQRVSASDAVAAQCGPDNVDEIGTSAAAIELPGFRSLRPADLLSLCPPIVKWGWLGQLAPAAP